MIRLEGLTKRFGDVTAVDGLSVEIAGGRVTGFLGPNGAGKSTTMRLILGLDRPSAGQALIDGARYSDSRDPLGTVGALLDARAVHTGRSARSHLRAMARSNGIPVSRADEVLALVGLEAVARRRVGTYSLGMCQRLGIAGALLGDPAVLLFDEPVNGLDVDGVIWIRELMRSLAAEGRTVFVSSHLMSEVQQAADHVVVIGRGRLIADAPVDEVVAGGTGHAVKVRSPDPGALDLLAGRLAESGDVVRIEPGELLARGADASMVGDLCADLGVRLHELSMQRSSLEDAYLELTMQANDYRAGDPDAPRRIGA